MTITVSGIVFGLLLLLPPIYILYVFSGKLAPKFILASAKLLIYTGILTAVMYVVCMLDNVLVSVLAALVMAVVAALAVVVKSRLKVQQFFVPACAGVAATTIVYALYVLYLVLGVKTPFAAHFFLPVCGLLVGGMLETNYKALATYYVGLEHHHQLYDYLIGNGAKHTEAVRYFVGKAIEKAAIAAISNMAYLVIGATPVIFWSMLLTGSDVFTALFAQIFLLIAVISATIVSVVVTLFVAKRYAFDAYDALV